MKRRTLRYPTFDDLFQDIDRLLSGGYDRAGTWSLGQIADHLSKVMTMSLDGFPSRMMWPMRVLARWFALGPILRHKVITQTFASPAYLMPSDAAPDREAVERLRAVVTRFQQNTGPLHPSPVFGTLTRDQWHEVHLWHCEHHLSFLHPRAGS